MTNEEKKARLVALRDVLDAWEDGRSPVICRALLVQWLQSKMDECEAASTAPETQRVGRVFVGVDRGSPNGDQPAYTEMEQQPDGSMLVTKCLVGDEARKEIERREARPAMDLKGLALQFRHAINQVLNVGDTMSGVSRDKIAVRCAQAALQFMNKSGGR